MGKKDKAKAWGKMSKAIGDYIQLCKADDYTDLHREDQISLVDHMLCQVTDNGDCYYQAESVIDRIV